MKASPDITESNGNCYGTTVLISSNQTRFVLSLQTPIFRLHCAIENLVLSTQNFLNPPKKTLQIVLNQLNQNIARIARWSSG